MYVVILFLSITSEAVGSRTKCCPGLKPLFLARMSKSFHEIFEMNFAPFSFEGFLSYSPETFVKFMKGDLKYFAIYAAVE